MKNSLYIGRIAGIQVFIHWTFPIIIFWIIFANLRQGLNSMQITWSVIFVLSLFVCVVLHELGHALAARRFQIQTKDITLLPIGGVARLEKMPEKPMQELIVALAGPAVNLVIVIVLFAIMQLTKLPTDFSVIAHVGPDNFLLSLAIVNLWLAIFNLIPAFPMDGGRVLRALLAIRLSRAVATNIAARIGQALAIGFVFVGFFYNPFLIFIGLFIFLGAMAESEQVQTQTVLKGHTVAEVTMKEIPLLQRQDTIAKAVELLLNGQARNFLVMDGDQPFGTLDRDGIIRALQQHSGNAAVDVATKRDPGFIEAGEPVENALQMMQQHKHTMLIVTKNKQLLGILDMENILEYIMVMNASAASPGRSA
ncbi:site-2 protease family protein [Chitinophaga sp. XS-30]|uniref:site-2 protease family protein n=1 Tax=Chitinophaga sp. XS-30 TaxID=2604421 RepID=UPI0011DE2810|nr:site-2 protease family protein [Chitinophaga sp. XS-30]QEH42973.1 CBS domain-containing protein [Chitinophaga sp. XS-30]